jgi:hypothetical protein
MKSRKYIEDLIKNAWGRPEFREVSSTPQKRKLMTSFFSFKQNTFLIFTSKQK